MASVYKHKRSKFYQTDIWIDGRKFPRSTGRTNKREAEIRAAELETELRQELGVQQAVETSLRIDDVAGRYMNDVGDHHAGEGAEITRGKVSLLIFHFGPDKLMSNIGNDDVFKLLNWRRRHRVGEWRRNDKGEWIRHKVSEKAKLLSPFTVNDTTEQLKKLFTYLKSSGVVIKTAPNFGDEKFWLKEPKSRPRSLSNKERTSLNEAMEIRPDAEPLILFARMTGKRKSESINLQWPHVKWDQGVIAIKGKGDAWVTIKITPAIRALLSPLRDHHPTHVFTYVAQRTMKVKRKNGTTEELVKGKRYPFNKDGLRRIWNKIRQEAGIPMIGDDRFRWHDQRHDFAINFLKKNPSAFGMKMLQKALDHTNFETTANTYGDVHVDDVADAVEAQGQELLKERLKRKPRTKAG
jgi:integrase